MFNTYQTNSGQYITYHNHSSSSRAPQTENSGSPDALATMMRNGVLLTSIKYGHSQEVQDQTPNLDDAK